MRKVFWFSDFTVVKWFCRFHNQKIHNLGFFFLNFPLFFTIGPPAVARRVLWNRVCPSFRPSILLSERFFWNWLVFSKFWHVVRNPYEVMCDSWIFQKKNFCSPNLRKWTKNGPKTGFFNSLKKFIIKFVL